MIFYVSGMRNLMKKMLMLVLKTVMSHTHPIKSQSQLGCHWIQMMS